MQKAVSLIVATVLAGCNQASSPDAAFIAEKMKPLLPIIHLDGSKLSSVEADKSKLIMRLTGMQDWKPALSDEQAQQINARSVCANAVFADFVKASGTLEIHISSKTNQQLPKIIISDCSSQ